MCNFLICIITPIFLHIIEKCACIAILYDTNYHNYVHSTCDNKDHEGLNVPDDDDLKIKHFGNVKFI